MNKLMIRLTLLVAIPCGALLVLLFSAKPISGGPLSKGPRSSVKGLKLKVSPNGRHFVDQHGKPFFYLGDTAWLLFQRFDQKEVDAYLKDRAGKGFTSLSRHPGELGTIGSWFSMTLRKAIRPNEPNDRNRNRTNRCVVWLPLRPATTWEHQEGSWQASTAKAIPWPGHFAFGKSVGALRSLALREIVARSLVVVLAVVPPVARERAGVR